MQQLTLVEPLLERYLDGDIPLYELRGSFYSGDVELRDAAEETLYAMVSMHLAMFTAGSWPEQELKDAIAWHVRRRHNPALPGPIPMHDRQWLDIVKSGAAPWPIQVNTHDDTPE
jgi:hypothetical protein